jgi:phosphate/phosphite/phosphonate ABC transporter binding protein
MPPVSETVQCHYNGPAGTDARERTSASRMKRLSPILLLGLVGCSGWVRIGAQPTAAPTATVTTAPTATPDIPTGPLGSEENPLVLALPPSTRPQADVLTAGKTLTSLLEKTTGYTFVSVIPPSEKELIHAFGVGNAHVAALSPFAYLLASQEGSVQAAFARQQDGAVLYGAEFIARDDPNYQTYFDTVQSKNLSEAAIALAQFKDKKPCWTDPRSLSGYVVPLGILVGAGIQTREPAFLASHAAVVRAVYAGGICDFGATYVDARAYPGLEDGLPDVMHKVQVIWRIPPIIPYEMLVFSHGMPVDVRRVLIRAFVDLTADADGSSAMQALYGFSTMHVAEDSLYADFRQAVEDSGLDLASLIE